jgi:hypothetical protein
MGTNDNYCGLNGNQCKVCSAFEECDWSSQTCTPW